MSTGSLVKKKHIVSLSLGELEGEKPCLGSEIFTRDSFLSDCSLSEIGLQLPPGVQVNPGVLVGDEVEKIHGFYTDFKHDQRKLAVVSSWWFCVANLTAEPIPLES